MRIGALAILFLVCWMPSGAGASNKKISNKARIRDIRRQLAEAWGVSPKLIRFTTRRVAGPAGAGTQIDFRDVEVRRVNPFERGHGTTIGRVGATTFIDSENRQVTQLWGVPKNPSVAPLGYCPSIIAPGIRPLTYAAMKQLAPNPWMREAVEKLGLGGGARKHPAANNEKVKVPGQYTPPRGWTKR